MSGQFARLQQSLHRAQPKQQPAEWYGLSWDDIDVAWAKSQDHQTNAEVRCAFARAIEAKLREKNRGVK